jgi:hypothetical protein
MSAVHSLFGCSLQDFINASKKVPDVSQHPRVRKRKTKWSNVPTMPRGLLTCATRNGRINQKISQYAKRLAS